MFTGGDGEQVILGQQLSEAIVVRDERSHDAKCATSFAEGFAALEVGCSHTDGGVNVDSLRI